jgi:hypothetical protein
MLSLSVFHVFSAIGSFQSWGEVLPTLFMSWGGTILG